MNNDTYITRINDVEIDAAYGKWLVNLKNRYQCAQIKTAIKVNGEKLLWNWQLGRDLVIRKAEERWGSGIVNQLSFDLKTAFPKEKGFGVRNLRYMEYWYKFYAEKLHQVGAESDIYTTQLLYNNQTIDNQHDIIWHQVGAKLEETSEEGLPFPHIFALIPWRHHIEIIQRCKNINEALFYIQKTVEQNWSRSSLMNCINTDLYHKQGRALTNFAELLPSPQAELAQEMTKENYDFGFVKLPDRYKEIELENALCDQMTRFLLELGKGFAFVGRQKEIVVSGRSRIIDLLFYHIFLRCYVVVELKVVPFEPEYIGKLVFYVNAVNHLIKTESDNPTIGLLVCSDMKNTEVKWSFEGVSSPIGVATYNNVQIEEIKKQLPSAEQLQAQVKLFEDEFNRRNKDNSII